MENLLQAATIDDARELAEMNRMLIDDEGSPNPMSVEQLEERLLRWLKSDTYRAVFIHHHNDIAGYVLYREEQDEFDRDQLNIYVRQFFVKRAYRRRGIGRSAFENVAQSHFPAHATIILEVLSTNLEGRAFWERLGFEPFFTTYRRPVKKETA